MTTGRSAHLMAGDLFARESKRALLRAHLGAPGHDNAVHQREKPDDERAVLVLQLDFYFQTGNNPPAAGRRI